MTEDEFVLAWRDHLSAISKFLSRRVDQSEVEDLAADVFEIAWRKKEQPQTGFELAWLYKIAGFVVANHRRKTFSRNGVVIALGLEQLVNASYAVNPELVAIRDLSLAEALKSLGEKDRALLTLTALDGLPVAQAASLLGLTANAASIRLNRARKLLAEKLS
ncbi:MAG: RNA polymerase sigma factor [Micrococcales bacterium]